MRYLYSSENSYSIHGVNLWTRDGSRSDVSLLIENGVVSEISQGQLTKEIPTSPHTKRIDGRGMVLLPAGVDPQVHLRHPGQPHKETIVSGSLAALHGGFSAFLTMPNTKPVLDEPSVIRDVIRNLDRNEKENGLRVLVSAAMTMQQRGRQVVDVEGCKRAGAVALTDDGVGVADDHVMLETFKQAQRFNIPVLQHAEVPGHGAVLASGPLQRLLDLKPYPEDAETTMVERDLNLLRQLSQAPGARYHVLHVSSQKTVALVTHARNQGINVTCEVSPHHLFFDSTDIREGETSFKMNPPLRHTTDKIALQKALRDGLIDFVATDHAPHEQEVKTSNFKTSAFGTTGLETSLKVLISLWRKGLLTEGRLVDVWSTAPAKFLGLDSSFGDIAPGKVFRATMISDMDTDYVVLPQDFFGLSKNSCFIHSHLPGKVRHTFIAHHCHEFR